MDRTEPCELTTLVLVRDGDKILLQQRNKEDWNGLVMPGGHAEPGESFVDAAKREVLEETGLHLDSLSLCGVKQFPYKGHRYIVFLFESGSFHGTLKDSEEGHNAWYDIHDLPEDELVMDFDLMLRMFTDPELIEFQYLEDKNGGLIPILFKEAETEKSREIKHID